MISVKHATLAAARPTAGIGAAMWDDDHDVPVATQAEAEAGTVDNKVMTPQRTAQAIAALAGGAGAVDWADVTGKPTAIANTTAAFTTAQETKLAGIATAATANASDAALRDRSTHTGTQAAGTITGLATVATTGAYSDLTGRPTLPIRGEVTVTPTDIGGVIEHTQTVTATGVTGSSVVFLSLAPHDDEDENDPELLDVLAIAARPLTDQIEITAAFGTRTSGPVKFNWSAF